MRKLILLAVMVVTLVSATTAGGAEPAGSADGSYIFTGSAVGSVFHVWNSFWVTAYADGTATGWFDYQQYRDGNPLSISGPLTCATIVGNRVWVGGLITNSTRPDLLGLEMWFQAQDNGGPPGWNPNRDMSTTVGAGGPGTGKQYCVDAPPARFPFLLGRGDIRVGS